MWSTLRSPGFHEDGRMKGRKERKKLSVHFFRILLTFVAQTNCQLFVH